MKFSMNGALTIGTLDGANVEIREEVGEENFFLFGLTADGVDGLQARGYRPRELLRAECDACETCSTSSRRASWPAATRPCSGRSWTTCSHHDPFLVLADYEAYVDCQERVSALWQQPERWTRASILNAARMGKFSSDRSIRDYCELVWGVRVATPIGQEMLT